MIIHDCDKRHMTKGYKIPSCGSYPCNAWGHYLPGDEPHEICSETEEDCSSYMELDVEVCPKFKETMYLCPVCLEDHPNINESLIILFNEKDTDEYYCPNCEETMNLTQEEIILEIKLYGTSNRQPQKLLKVA